MIEFFQQKQIFLKVTVYILALFIADDLILMAFGKIVDGKVTRMVISSGGYKSPPVNFPIIEFSANGRKYTLKGNRDTYYKPGSTVRIIFRPWWPGKAKVYTFWGIIKRPLIQFIIIFLLWAMLYSSFKKRKPSKSRT
jgi:hypothetical protein